MRKHLTLAALAVAACLGSGAAAAQTKAVALVAAIGEQIEVVRQKESTGSRFEPFARQRLPINGPALNHAVLRGLDRAIAESDPQAQRVLLQWNPPHETLVQLDDASGAKREAMILDALKKHLGTLSDRQQWDRIEAILPTYQYGEKRGMGSKLSGIGIFVQPLLNTRIGMGENGELTSSSGQNDAVIHPDTGKPARSTTYVAPYMYFERITLDARTLEVLSRNRYYESVRYFKPEAQEEDPLAQMPLPQLLGKLVEQIERSAYKSVRGTANEVRVSVPVAVAASAPQ